jgi:NAD(P) transhydrogenase subunit alpha
MKPVMIDLAAEKGGNCKLTVMDEKIVTENGVSPSSAIPISSVLHGGAIIKLLCQLIRLFIDRPPDKRRHSTTT